MCSGACDSRSSPGTNHFTHRRQLAASRQRDTVLDFDVHSSCVLELAPREFLAGHIYSITCDICSVIHHGNTSLQCLSEVRRNTTQLIGIATPRFSGFKKGYCVKAAAKHVMKCFNLTSITALATVAAFLILRRYPTAPTRCVGPCMTMESRVTSSEVSGRPPYPVRIKLSVYPRNELAIPMRSQGVAGLMKHH